MFFRERLSPLPTAIQKRGQPESRPCARGCRADSSPASLRPRASRACSCGTLEEGRGVPLRRRYSEREEETRDRAERGSAVRGSDQASAGAREAGRVRRGYPAPTPRDVLRSKRAPRDPSSTTKANLREQRVHGGLACASVGGRSACALRVEPVRGLDQERVVRVQTEHVVDVVAEAELPRLIARELAPLLPNEEQR